MLQLKRRNCARVQTEMVELIALQLPLSSERKIWPSDVVFVKGGQ